MSDQLITSAVIRAPGDPSVGIMGHEIHVEYLDFDPDCLAEEDQPAAVAELRAALARVGELVTGEPCAVWLLPQDAPEED
jgi:hypothetical protein